MRLITYGLRMDSDRKPSLIKEATSNYPSLQRMICTPLDLYDLLSTVYDVRNLAEEYGWLIAVDQKCHVIGVMEISHGCCNNAVLDPKQVFWRLCMCGAVQFFLAHNHPSGDPAPSAEDDKITARLKKCGELMGIDLLDHIVVGDGRFYSYKSEGVL